MTYHPISPPCRPDMDIVQSPSHARPFTPSILSYSPVIPQSVPLAVFKTRSHRLEPSSSPMLTATTPSSSPTFSIPASAYPDLPNVHSRTQINHERKRFERGDVGQFHGKRERRNNLSYRGNNPHLKSRMNVLPSSPAPHDLSPNHSAP